MEATTIKKPTIMMQEDNNDIAILQKMSEDHHDEYGVYPQALLRSLGKKIEGKQKAKRHN